MSRSRRLTFEPSFGHPRRILAPGTVGPSIAPSGVGRIRSNVCGSTPSRPYRKEQLSAAECDIALQRNGGRSISLPPRWSYVGAGTWLLSDQVLN